MKISLALILALGLSGVELSGAGPSGPVAGFILDSRTATIRPMTGVPGALRLAEAVALPFGVSAAEFTASGDAAVTVTAVALTMDQPAHLAVIGSLPSSAPLIVDLGEVAEDTRILAVNAKGTAAVVYSASQQQLRFVSGVNKNPVLSTPVSTAALAGTVTVGVLDESGSCAVLGTGSVETLCSDGASRRVLSETTFKVTALGFGNSGRDLWVVDAAARQVLRVGNYAQQSAPVVFASETDGLVRPIALAVTVDGQVLVADSDAAAVFAIDPLAPSVKAIRLDIAPSQLRPLTDRSLLLINDLSALPFTLFSTEAMRTYFVPAN